MSMEIGNEMSEREKVNDYLAMKRIESEKEYQIASVKNLSVYPVWGVRGAYSHEKVNEATISYMVKEFTDKSKNPIIEFYYICKLYIPIRDEIVYVIVEDKNEFINLFIDDITIDNEINKNINFKQKEKVKIDIDIDTSNKQIKLMEKDYDKNRYNSNTKLTVRNKFSYFNDINLFLTNNLYTIGDESFQNRVFDLDILLDDEHKAVESVFNNSDWIHNKNIKSTFIDKVLSIQNEISFNNIDNKTLAGRITDTSVNDKITIFVESEDIIHNKKLKYEFDKPTENNIEFYNFCKKMNVDSIDELETTPVILSIESGISKNSSQGWYIKSRTESNIEGNDSLIISFIKSIIFS